MSTPLQRAHKVHITEELLRHLYITEGRTTYDIAELIGCSQDTICRRLKEYHIPRREKRRPIDEESLTHLYITKDYSVGDLAEYFQVSKRTIYQRLHDLGLRPIQRRNTQCQHLPMKPLIEAYESGTSASALSKQYKVSTTTIIKALRDAGITIRQGRKRRHINGPQLKYLYENSRFSTTYLGKLFCVKPCTIAARLREMGVTLRGNRAHLPERQIIDAYREGESLGDLANRFHTSYTIVRDLLIRHRVYQKARRFSPYAEKMKELKEDFHMSTAEIAQRYQCHQETVRRMIQQVSH